MFGECLFGDRPCVAYAVRAATVLAEGGGLAGCFLLQPHRIHGRRVILDAIPGVFEIRYDFVPADQYDHELGAECQGCDAVADHVQVDHEEVKTYYEENQAEFYSPEKVEARHILIKVDRDADENAVEAARVRAVEIYDRILKGEDFAELAKQVSEGPSKSQGGYLGTFGRGRMVKPFEDQAFVLQAGEVSEPIRTDFGWHIIKVEKHNAAQTLSLEASQDKIRGQLSDKKARALALEDAESAYDMSYGGDDLLAAAERLGVTVTTTEALARNNAIPGVADSEKFLSTGFSLDEMAVSDVQDLGDGFYIIQTLEKIPSQIQSFETVQARVQQDLL